MTSDTSESATQQDELTDWMSSRGGLTIQTGLIALFVGYLMTDGRVMLIGLAVAVVGYVTVGYDYVLPKIRRVVS